MESEWPKEKAENQESHLLVSIKMFTYIDSFTNIWVDEFTSARI